MTQKTLITGFPRIGENRELKRALESYWAGKTSQGDLENIAGNLRKKHWLEQRERGIEHISSNDFSYYDAMLDTSVMLNAIPERFRNIENGTDRYFAMARGSDEAEAMGMTKWFNTNYHYIVPELDDTVDFRLNPAKIINEYREALALGIKTKINIIGPVTYLGLSQTADGKDPYDYLEKVLPLYGELLEKLSEIDDTLMIQFDEPILVKDPSGKLLSLLGNVYGRLASVGEKIKIIVTTYFEHSAEAVKALARTDIWGIGLDFVHGLKNMDALDSMGEKRLVAGVVDGRNIWINDLDKTLALLDKISEHVPKERILISTSCSLLHVPYSRANEPESPIREWLAFGLDKVEEVALLASLFHNGGKDGSFLRLNREKNRSRRESPLIHDASVRRRLERSAKTEREGNFRERIEIQRKELNLPLLPTTTIGSFPQTGEIRKRRRDFRKGTLSAVEYESRIKEEIGKCVAFQDEIGLDVLVHGESERNDMVEYFGELLNGFHFTKTGWVQSYGSRCVKPPVIYGDISRPEPMTVKWITYAQSRTARPMKGMLTGPVTIINWSFVRDDVPRSLIARQIALSLSDEVDDLQKRGIKIIQVDEAAFKEGYPLRKEHVPEYESWALESFRLAVSSAEKSTQIHSHMCYSDFNDIIDTIEKMDADVITIETARSGNRLLEVFRRSGYPNEIGPGVYDIHSPRVPSVKEFKDQISERLQVLPLEKMWVNPDCGLKTRGWDEVSPALSNMVGAVRELRQKNI